LHRTGFAGPGLLLRQIREKGAKKSRSSLEPQDSKLRCQGIFVLLAPVEEWRMNAWMTKRNASPWIRVKIHLRIIICFPAIRKSKSTIYPFAAPPCNTMPPLPEFCDQLASDSLVVTLRKSSRKRLRPKDKEELVEPYNIRAVKKSKRSYAPPETYAHLNVLQDCLREYLDGMHQCLTECVSF
jgi:hypothetical protein